ncbi:MAG: oxidoreductase [Candidatus Binatus sp.]|jgi:NAD(P)-dependent dehydrogenase (short-subunit alcohol dehydrogenase family)|uniref:oxidoreductase n=1 Tax=Candidatus Binatus sp. TaxID=2811406 RepID=UPI003C731F6B
MAEKKFGAKSTALEVIAGHDLSGRDAIVTGGASGIGVETVRALAVAGARVVLATRDRAKGDSVAATLRKETARDSIEFRALDLASLASVRAFVAEYLKLKRKLHILINNAGIMATPLAYTADGFESQFGTNHLGHFALTTGLLPALKAADKARIVELTSIGHRRSDVHFDDLNFHRRPYDPWDAYGQSKTANVLFAVGATERLRADSIVANAVHPGGIMSGLQKYVSREEQIKMGWIDESGTVNPRFKSTEQGAATSIWAAVASELEGVGGRYLEDCSVAKPWSSDSPFSGVMPYALDASHARQLWSVSEELIAQS